MRVRERKRVQRSGDALHRLLPACCHLRTPPPSPGRPGCDKETLLKYGCLSANTVTEEAIDMVLHDSYPGAERVWDDYKLLKWVLRACVCGVWGAGRRGSPRDAPSWAPLQVCTAP